MSMKNIYFVFESVLMDHIWFERNCHILGNEINFNIFYNLHIFLGGGGCSMGDFPREVGGTLPQK